MLVKVPIVVGSIILGVLAVVAGLCYVLMKAPAFIASKVGIHEGWITAMMFSIPVLLGCGVWLFIKIKENVTENNESMHRNLEKKFSNCGRISQVNQK